jgi:hypothetical protein
LRAYIQLFELWLELVVRRSHLNSYPAPGTTHAEGIQRSAVSSPRPAVRGRSLSLDPSD